MKDEDPITAYSFPYGHGFYQKMGFLDTDGEQITNGVRHDPMKM
ncbi:MAG: GNAT family N-acetyltransferase [Bacteroidales bacterium]|nr:GNAT family N-acetyltransferase [Bacteroidales bacterium]